MARFWVVEFCFLGSRALRVLAVLLLSGALVFAEPLWPRSRGPAHGRAHVAQAPKPPLRLAYRIALWHRFASDSVLFEPEARATVGSPAALGIAWRVDDKKLYAFECGFYEQGRKVAWFDRKTGKCLGRATSKGAQPCANKRAYSLHDDCGFGRFAWFGGFYAGTPLFGIAKDKLIAQDIRKLRIETAGHATEGTRWLMGRTFLEGGGARIEDGPQYFWGHDVCQWRPDAKPRVILKDVSVPCAAWDARGMVLFTRGDLSEATPRGRLRRHEYVAMAPDGSVAARRVVKNLFREPDNQTRMLNRGRNTVHAIALGVVGDFVYCHERVGNGQRIVRRERSNFLPDAGLGPDKFPRVSERGFAGQVNVELGIGMAVDALRVYVHHAGTLEAYTLDFATRLYRRKLPKRTLNAHSPFAMSRYQPNDNTVYACRGTENTVATDGRYVYLTTDTTFQVHDARTGRRVWSYTFQDLPVYEQKVDGRWLSQAGLPGDVIVTPDAVYVATHGDQSALYAFVPATK